jgi:hypothetical protein
MLKKIASFWSQAIEYYHTNLLKENWWMGLILFRKLPSKARYGKKDSDGKRRRRRKQLPDGLKKTSGNWKLKEEALARTVENSVWKDLWTCSRRDYGMNE